MRRWLFIAFLAAISLRATYAQFPLTVFVVRHAEKAATPVDDPRLSDAGSLRAQSLALALKDTGVTAIYASEAARTQLTVKPLADRLKLEINRQFPAAKQRELAQAILKRQDRVVLVAGHSNTVPELIQALGGGVVPPIQDAWEFDNLYVVTILGPGQARTLRLHYGEPSRPGPVTLASGGARIMRIRLARSGGFAALPGLAMEADVDLSGNAGRVTQKQSGYSRDMSPQEAQQLRTSIDPVRFFALPEELRSLNESSSKSGRTSPADQRQYDITIQLDNGKEHTVRASELMTSDLEKLCPGLGNLLEWTKQEFDKIQNYRVQQR
jgi:phosphohistidine phosphatase SixA